MSKFCIYNCVVAAVVSWLSLSALHLPLCRSFTASSAPSGRRRGTPLSATTPTTTAYDRLMEHTIVVADTGDVDAISSIQPEDATTNPSLIAKAASMPKFQNLIDDAVQKSNGDLSLAMDKVAVNFGTEIARIVPGYVSTEVDARLSFDTKGTIEKARKLIRLYEENGIDKSRILIKIAATWEGIRAAEILEKEDRIKCNLTLLFSKTQAVACAEAGVTLISPFVGRIMDYYKAEELKKDPDFKGFVPPSADPGVQSVTEIYNYYKAHGYDTIVMGASFRNVDEIIELTGCDRLTISPELIEKLKQTKVVVGSTEDAKKLDAAKVEPLPPSSPIDEKNFRMGICENAMCTEKVAQGIRAFVKDTIALETILKEKMTKQSDVDELESIIKADIDRELFDETLENEEKSWLRELKDMLS